MLLLFLFDWIVVNVVYLEEEEVYLFNYFLDINNLFVCIGVFSVFDIDKSLYIIIMLMLVFVNKDDILVLW